MLADHAKHFYGQVGGSLDQLESYQGARGRETTWRWGFLESLWNSATVDDPLRCRC